MPPLLPLEIVVTAVPQLHQRLDLPLYRYLARARQHVPATTLRRRGDGVLEMHVPDVTTQLPHRVLGLFLARLEQVVRVSWHRHVSQCGLLWSVIQLLNVETTS